MVGTIWAMAMIISLLEKGGGICSQHDCGGHKAMTHNVAYVLTRMALVTPDNENGQSYRVLFVGKRLLASAIASLAIGIGLPFGLGLLRASPSDIV